MKEFLGLDVVGVERPSEPDTDVCRRMAESIPTSDAQFNCSADALRREQPGCCM